MFIDYYSILEVDKESSFEEIKSAFRKQCIKWHPDKNLGTDTTEKMQLINEAYLILKDSEARAKYDIEWEAYHEYLKNKNIYQNQEIIEEVNEDFTEYKFQDEILEKWMNNAKKQSVDLAKQAIKDFKDIATEGAKGSLRYIIYQIIVIFISFLIFKTCNN